MQLPPSTASTPHSSSAVPSAAPAVPAAIAPAAAAAPEAAAAAAPEAAAAAAPVAAAASDAVGAPNPIAPATPMPVQATLPATIAPAPAMGLQGTNHGNHAMNLNGRNHSYHAIIHPSMFVDPGAAHFFIVITLGYPIGIITDLVFFYDLVRRNAQMKYGIYGTFAEAHVHYKVEHNLNNVQLLGPLDPPLPLVSPGSAANPIFVSSAAPTPVRAPVARVPRNRHLFRHTVVGPRTTHNAGAQNAGQSSTQAGAEAASGGGAPPSSSTRVARELAESLPPSSPPPASPTTDASTDHSDVEIESEDSDSEQEPAGQAELIDPRLSRIGESRKHPRFGLHAATGRSGRTQSAPPQASLGSDKRIVLPFHQ